MPDGALGLEVCLSKVGWLVAVEVKIGSYGFL